MKALKIKQIAEERHLKYYETNKYWLSIKAKTSKKIIWIPHKSVSSKLQKCENLQK